MNAVAQLSADALADGVWTVSAGNAAQGVALAAREAGARASVLVMDGAPADQAQRHRAARRDDRQGAVRRVLARGRDHAVRSDDAAGSSIRSTTTTSSAATARPRSRSSKTCRTSMPWSRRWAAAACSPASASRHARAAAGRRRSTPPSRRTPRRSRTSLGGRPRQSRFENWSRSWVDGAGGQSVLPSMWPLLAERASPSPSSSRSTTPRARCGWRPSAATSSSKARPPARRRGAVAAMRERRPHARSSPSSPAATSISRFASLVGACPPDRHADAVSSCVCSPDVVN